MRRTLAALGGAILLLSGGCDSSGDDGNLSPPPPPSPPPPAVVPQLGVQQVFPQIALGAPLALQQAPNDATVWYAIEQAGVVRAFENIQGVSQSLEFLNIAGRVTSGGERGLLGIAFHPDYPNTPEVFVSYTGQDNGLTSFVSRFTLDPVDQTLDETSEEVIFTVPQPATNHNGGNIVFGPDGYLYIGFGDGGGAGDPQDNAQDNTNVLGSMIRIDVDGGSPYAIPQGNPFETNQTCPQGFTVSGEECPEIYAYGLRNPWRWSFDSLTGELWLGDVGQGAWEEVDIITAGGNFGWRCREGAHDYNTTGCGTGFIDPITEYGRNLGNSITGGYVYRGALVPDLAGWYVFADYGSGRIFGIPADSTSFIQPEILAEPGLNIATFGQGVDDGELYVVDIVNGDIYQIVEAP